MTCCHVWLSAVAHAWGWGATGEGRQQGVRTALLVARGRVLLAQDKLGLRVEALVGLAGLLHQGCAVVVQAQAVAVAPAVARDRLPLLLFARGRE